MGAGQEEALPLAQFTYLYIRLRLVKCVSVDLTCPEIVEGPEEASPN